MADLAVRGRTFPVRLTYIDNAYAKGGLVKEALAVKKAGRYGDTRVVHINDAEYAELCKEWGKPTINPETGLPEFFLGKVFKKIGKVAKKALPIASMAANFIPGVGPLVSAGLGAAGAALNGGGIKGALMAAAPAAMGAAGNALSGAGASAPTISTATSPALNADMNNISQIASTATPAPAAEATAPQAAAPQAGALTQAAQPKVKWGDRDFLGLGILPNKIAVPALALGAAALFDKKPKDKLQTAEQFFGGKINNNFGSSAMPALKGQFANLGQRRDRPLDEYARAGYMPETQYFAHGGDVEGEGSSTGSRSFAVQGEGDGREDKIKALLSDGEYVIDAETVALLGNGSSKAGAKALDDFRVNIRKHKGKQLAKGKFSLNAKKPDAYMRGGRA